MRILVLAALALVVLAMPVPGRDFRASVDPDRGALDWRFGVGLVTFSGNAALAPKPGEKRLGARVAIGNSAITLGKPLRA